jgi:general secretion pathway protein G
MQMVKRNRNRRRGGFTLLEVLLVVGIIALLAAFVVPSFLNTEQRARVDTAKAMVKSGGTLATQIELFRQAMGRYPNELKELYEKPEDDEEADKWTGPYITNLDSLKDPWDNELQYKGGDEEPEFNPGRYDLWSIGPDEEDSTDDDIGNWTKED